jgi:type IV pilus assembly protein PilO
MALDLNEKPWYVALIVGLVLGVALYVSLDFYIFKEKKAQIDRTLENIDALDREIEKGRQAKADLPRIEEDIRRYELELDRLRKILPTKRETDTLIKSLKQLTERGRFRLVRFQPGEYQEQDFYQEWPIKIDLDGVYHELGLFFDRLSNFSRLINVNQLSIKPPGGKGEGAFTINASFTAQTFIYKEDDGKGGSNL